MKKIKISRLVMLSVHLFVLILMFLLLAGARGFVNAGAQVEAVRYVNHMIVSVDGGPEQRVELPYSFQNLAPGPGYPSVPPLPPRNTTRYILKASIVPPPSI